MILRSLEAGEDGRHSATARIEDLCAAHTASGRRVARVQRMQMPSASAVRRSVLCKRKVSAWIGEVWPRRM
jgi:hypothetical protein